MASIAQMTPEQIASIQEEVLRLRKENAEMKRLSSLQFEITERGQVAIVFGNYRCRLYKTQWIKILNQHEEVRKFIAAHENELE